MATAHVLFSLPRLCAVYQLFSYSLHLHPCQCLKKYSFNYAKNITHSFLSCIKAVRVLRTASCTSAGPFQKTEPCPTRIKEVSRHSTLRKAITIHTSCVRTSSGLIKPRMHLDTQHNPGRLHRGYADHTMTHTTMPPYLQCKKWVPNSRREQHLVARTSRLACRGRRASTLTSHLYLHSKGSHLDDRAIQN